MAQKIQKLNKNAFEMNSDFPVCITVGVLKLNKVIKWKMTCHSLHCIN